MYGDVKTVKLGDPDYPALLKEIHNPPKVLYYKGTLSRNDERSIAIVGARRCTKYGTKVTTEIAGDLSEAGFTIISGLALGIDGLAHQAAIDNGSRTIAVMACGLDKIYPKEHLGLAEEVMKNGALISEYPLGTPLSRQNFPARNRIISGLARVL